LAHPLFGWLKKIPIYEFINPAYELSRSSGRRARKWPPKPAIRRLGLPSGQDRGEFLETAMPFTEDPQE
jgi:hypothetical protein